MTASAAAIALSSIGYALGAPKPIDALPELREHPTILAALQQGGMRNYLDYDGEVLDLAAQAVEQTFAHGLFQPSEIDCVVFASDSLGIGGNSATLVAFLDRFGLDAAYPIAVRLSECANFHMAMAIAKTLVAAGRYKNILLISADLARLASPSTRIVGGGVSVMSDSAASCVVSGKPAEGFTIEAVATMADRALQRSGLASNEELKIRVNLHRGLFRTLLGEAGLPANSVRAVFPSNFIATAVRLFHLDSGFSANQISLDNLPRIGHCLGCDGLIGLADAMARGPIEEGERFVLSGAGPTQLGATLLAANAFHASY